MRRRGATGAFVRDGPTVVSYGALGAYAFCLYAFGPALALLRSELHFSYTLVSVHTSLWAAGAALVGVTFAPACRRLGRRLVLWWSALGTAAGAVLLAEAHVVALTLLAAGVLGTAGTMLQTATQSILSDRHGPRRDRALVESNIGAGVCALVAPLALGFLQGTPPGWRIGIGLPPSDRTRLCGSLIPSQRLELLRWEVSNGTVKANSIIPNDPLKYKYPGLSNTAEMGDIN